MTYEGTHLSQFAWQGLVLMNLVLAILWYSFDMTVQEEGARLGGKFLKPRSVDWGYESDSETQE